jgi:hypothetical protein
MWKVKKALNETKAQTHTISVVSNVSKPHYTKAQWCDKYIYEIYHTKTNYDRSWWTGHLRFVPCAHRDNKVIRMYRQHQLSDYELAVALGAPQTDKGVLALSYLLRHSKDQNVRLEARMSFERAWSFR